MSSGTMLPKGVTHAVEIGAGSHSVVYRAVWRGRPVAVKSIPKKKHNRDQWVTETDMMRTLSGAPNLVRMLGQEETEEAYHILMELAEGIPGDALVGGAGLLGAGDEGASPGSGAAGATAARAAPAAAEAELRRWGRDVARALEYCHDRDIVFNDVKPANMMLVRGGPATLVDCGLCRYPYMYAGMPIGTPVYFAPEKFDARNEVPADVWALGVSLYMMTCGEHPFCRNRTSLMRLRDDILAQRLAFDQPVWGTMSAGYKEALSAMLVKDFLGRASASRAVEMLASPLP